MHSARKETVCCYLRLLRFDSWKGWIFNFALGGVFFAIPPFDRFASFSLSFILATAGIFVLNQYFDRESDKLNDLKRNLPVSSGRISPKTAVLVFLALTVLSVCPVLFTDVNAFPLFLAYIGLWICYSAPPTCFKGRPIVDVVVAGVGSGVLPFIIGLQASHQLTLEFSLPWIMRRYQDAFISAIPLMLFQSAGHIFQAFGDYDADLNGNINTFVVKYGKKTSMKAGNLLLTTCLLLPILYEFLDLSLTDYLFWYLVILVACAPAIYHVMNLLRSPSKDNFNALRAISGKAGSLMLVVVWICVFLIRLRLT